MYLNSFFFLRFFKEIYGITVNNDDVFAYFKGKKKTELVLKCHWSIVICLVRSIYPKLVWKNKQNFQIGIFIGH